jgi:vitamin B12 transporter
VPQAASAESAAPTTTKAVPVVVSDTCEPIPVADVGSTVTIITGEELEDRQIRIVSDALRAVPGVASHIAAPEQLLPSLDGGGERCLIVSAI